VYGAGKPDHRFDQNLTVRPGRWPALKMEYSIMNGNHPQLAFDLAKIARNEKIARANQARLISEAKCGREKRIGIVAVSRRIFGGAIINLGQAVHGGRVEQVDASAVSTATLRMAR